MLKKLISNKTVCIFLIIITGFLIYSNSLSNSFQFDDNFYIVQNYIIRDICKIGAIWNYNPFRFIPILSFSVNYRFGGLDVLGYHLFNISIHIFTAIFVFVLVAITLKTPVMRRSGYRQNTDILPLFCALVFLSHPVQTEAVTYISQRITALAGLFYIAAICFYALGRSTEGKRRFFVYVLSFLSCIAAFSSKEIALTLPVILFAYDRYFFNGNNNKRNYDALLFLFTIFAIAFFAGIKMFGGDPRKILAVMGGRTHVISHWDYLITQLRVIVTYLRLVFLPINQSIDYDYPALTSIFVPGVIAGTCAVSVIIFLIVKLYKGHRIISYGMAWFLITLLPYLSKVSYPDMIFEHRLYLPLAGASFAFVFAIWRVSSKYGLKYFYAFMLLSVMVLSGMTYARNFVWADGVTLWSDALKAAPRKPRVYCNRALGYFIKGEYDKAISDYDKALQMDPDLGFAFIGRGKVYMARGNYRMGLRDLTHAILATDLGGKGHGTMLESAYLNRAKAYLVTGEIDKATADLSKMIQRRPGTDPGLFPFYKLRASIYLKKDLPGKAIDDYTKAIHIYPENFDIYFGRGNAYMMNKEIGKALDDYEKAAMIDPENPHLAKNRAVAFFMVGDHDSSVSEVEKAKKNGAVISKDFIRQLDKAIQDR